MDSALLNGLYRQYHHQLYLYLLRLTGNPDAAEDLVQETFLKAILALPDGHPNMRAWLYTVARNLLISTWRKNGKLETLEDDPPCGDSALDSILRDERQRLLYRAIGHLDRRKREVLQLQYFSGLSQKEIAAVLRITPENVRTLAYRAKRELRKELEEQGYDIS